MIVIFCSFNAIEITWVFSFSFFMSILIVTWMFSSIWANNLPYFYLEHGIHKFSLSTDEPPEKKSKKSPQTKAPASKEKTKVVASKAKKSSPKGKKINEEAEKKKQGNS